MVVAMVDGPPTPPRTSRRGKQPLCNAPSCNHPISFHSKGGDGRHGPCHAMGCVCPVWTPSPGTP